MPKLLRRAGKLIRRAGKLARDGCRSACCSQEPRYVKGTNCCFATQVAWFNVAILCAGQPIYPALVRLSVTFPGRIAGCYRTDPTIIRTQAEILAMGYNQGQILDALPPGSECHPGQGCEFPGCECPGCCSEGQILLCAPPGQPPPTQCCNCGSDFTLHFLARFNGQVQAKFFSPGAICTESSPGFCFHPCTGAGGNWCQGSMSAKVPVAVRNGLREFAYRFRCQPDGTWNVTCESYNHYDTLTETEYNWENDPYLCQSCDGYTPTVRTIRYRTVNETCEDHPTFDPHTACSIDASTAFALANLGGLSGYMPNPPPGWENLPYSCSGNLITDPVPPLAGPCRDFNSCSGKWYGNPGRRMQVKWDYDFSCRRGSCRVEWQWEGFEFVNSFGGFAITDISWTVTRHAPCPDHLITCRDDPQPIVVPGTQPPKAPRSMMPTYTKGPGMLNIRGTRELF